MIIYNNLKNTFKISKLIDDLKRINLNLWEQEDNIRIKEKHKINQKTESKYSEKKFINLING
jgi:hypothetical protein